MVWDSGERGRGEKGVLGRWEERYDEKRVVSASIEWGEPQDVDWSAVYIT